MNTGPAKRVKVKTPKDAKGIEALKILETTTNSVLQSRINPKSAVNLKHCHALKASRDIVRIDRQPWEERVGNTLKIHEKHRFEKANALYHALHRIQFLLTSAKRREDKLKETTNELERTGSYLKSLLDSMADILIATDPRGIITEVNRAAEQISGFDRAVLIGKSFQTLFDDPETAWTGLEDVFAQKEVFDFELTLTTKDNQTVPLMLNATMLTDPDGIMDGILINARDITELKKAQEAQELYAQELARANADLEEFAQVASHDLQEPLKKVAGYAESLAQRYRNEFDQQAIDDLDFMIRQAAYMRELIRNVLDYAKVDTGEIELTEIDCNQLLDQALENLRELREETGIEIRRDPLPTIRANGNQLVRVFQNLVGNAIKYRDPAKEESYIHVSARKTGEIDIELPKTVTVPGWVFSVADNGSGIDPDFAEDIFNMFVRLDNEQEGSGMGLAIVRKIISRHEGLVWLESEPGEFSCFYFFIPDDTHDS
ncbi:MAG: ATP-binding protein [Proteobacteria bacterium]|nr:ATP-binding protein [Pseudomonadota bacterium]